MHFFLLVWHALLVSVFFAFLWRNETEWPVDFVTRNVGRIFGYSR